MFRSHDGEKIPVHGNGRRRGERTGFPQLGPDRRPTGHYPPLGQSGGNEKKRTSIDRHDKTTHSVNFPYEPKQRRIVQQFPGYPLTKNNERIVDAGGRLKKRRMRPDLCAAVGTDQHLVLGSRDNYDVGPSLGNAVVKFLKLHDVKTLMPDKRYDLSFKAHIPSSHLGQ